MKRFLICILLVITVISCKETKNHQNEQNHVNSHNENAQRFSDLKTENEKLYLYCFVSILGQKPIKYFDDAIFFWGQPLQNKEQKKGELGDDYIEYTSSYKGFNIIHNIDSDGKDCITRIQVTSKSDFSLNIGDTEEKANKILGEGSLLDNGVICYSTEEIVMYMKIDKNKNISNIDIFLEGR